jgi:hypothetical protein
LISSKEAIKLMADRNEIVVTICGQKSIFVAIDARFHSAANSGLQFAGGCPIMRVMHACRRAASNL